MTSPRTQHQSPNYDSRIRPLVALRGFWALARDPNDITQLTAIRTALKGRRRDPLHDRFLRSPRGEALLRRPTTLLDSLSDRPALARLPEGSLGRAYLAFMECERLSAEDLFALSDAPAVTLGERPDLGSVLKARLVEMHDLLHVVTGNGRDLVGEASLGAFAYAQTRNRALGFIVGLTYALSYLRLPGFLRPRAILANAPEAFRSSAGRVELRRRMSGLPLWARRELDHRSRLGGVARALPDRGSPPLRHPVGRELTTGPFPSCACA